MSTVKDFAFIFLQKTQNFPKDCGLNKHAVNIDKYEFLLYSEFVSKLLSLYAKNTSRISKRLHLFLYKIMEVS